MHSVEVSAKTRKEAIQAALDQLGIEMHEVENIEILDEGSKGFFGLGARPVRVKVSVKRAPHHAREGGDRGRDRDRDRRDRGGRPERGQQGPQGQRHERGQQGQRQERNERGERSESAARPERTSRGEQGERGERGDRGRRGGRNRGGRPDQGGQPQRRAQEPRGQQSQPQRPAREPRPDRPPRPERPPRPTVVEDEATPRGDSKDTGTLMPTPEIDVAPMTDEQGREAAALLQDVIAKMGIEATVEYKRDEDGSARLNVASPDSALLIGRKGRNLQAMQYIINRIIARADSNEVSERLLVDIEGYVDRRREALEELAKNLAERAKATGRDVHLKPLSPQERRVVHLTLQGDSDVRTFSIGDSLHRIVVISPKNRRGGGGGRGFGGRGRGPRRDDRAPRPRREMDSGQADTGERAESSAPREAVAVEAGAPPVIVMPAARAKRPPAKRRRGLRPLRYGHNAERPADGAVQEAAPAGTSGPGEHSEG